MRRQNVFPPGTSGFKPKPPLSPPVITEPYLRWLASKNTPPTLGAIEETGTVAIATALLDFGLTQENVTALSNENLDELAHLLYKATTQFLQKKFPK